MPANNIRQIATSIKTNYDKIPNENKTKKDAEIAQAGLNTCFRNAIGIDPTVRDDLTLNDDSLNNIERHLFTESEHTPTSSSSIAKIEEDNDEIIAFCKALDLEQIPENDDDSITDAIGSSASITGQETITEYASEVLANPLDISNNARINTIKAARKVLDLDSPSKLNNFSLITTIAKWLVIIIKSKFELSQKTLEDALFYEKETKEVCDLVESSELTFTSPIFKGKEKESDRIEYINNILQNAREAVSSRLISFLPGYDCFTNEEKPDQNVSSSAAIDNTLTTTSGTPRKALKYD